MWLMAAASPAAGRHVAWYPQRRGHLAHALIVLLAAAALTFGPLPSFVSGTSGLPLTRSAAGATEERPAVVRYSTWSAPRLTKEQKKGIKAIRRKRLEAIVKLKRHDQRPPPMDDELANMTTPDPRKRWRKHRPKREIRGTRNFNMRMWREEAERLRPYTQPLVERGLSIPEITFVLNRMAPKLIHLLWRPWLGIPAFPRGRVKFILRNTRVNGVRLKKFVRPEWLPPKAPGAPYPWYCGEYFAKVPPLKPWPPGGKALKEPQAVLAEDAPAEAEAAEGEE